MTGACAGRGGPIEPGYAPEKYCHFHPRLSYAILTHMSNHIYLAKIVREEPVPGINRVFLELIRDEDAVELVGGEEFVTVAMQIDPFA